MESPDHLRFEKIPIPMPQSYVDPGLKEVLEVSDPDARVVSHVYTPGEGYTLDQQDPNGHYALWGYSLAMEQGGANDGEQQNTAVFRILPGGLTEPVFVTKAEADAAFTVSVVSGTGVCIRLNNEDGTVEQLPMSPDRPVVIRPGQSYSYINTGETDLVLHDVARPAFKNGDDAPIFTSELPAKDMVRPNPRDGYSVCLVATSQGQRALEVPDAFYNPIYEQFMKRKLNWPDAA